MRIEGQQNGFTTHLVRYLANTVQDHLMPAVHAIECTNGEHRSFDALKTIYIGVNLQLKTAGKGPCIRLFSVKKGQFSQALDAEPKLLKLIVHKGRSPDRKLLLSPRYFKGTYYKNKIEYV